MLISWFDSARSQCRFWLKMCINKNQEAHRFYVILRTINVRFEIWRKRPSTMSNCNRARPWRRCTMLPSSQNLHLNPISFISSSDMTEFWNWDRDLVSEEFFRALDTFMTTFSTWSYRIYAQKSIKVKSNQMNWQLEIEMTSFCNVTMSTQ